MISITKTSNAVLTTAFIGLISLGGIGCKTDPSSGSASTPSTTIDSNTASSVGMCLAPTPTIVPEGRYVRATLSQSGCAQLQVCLDPSAWQNLPQNKYIPGIDVVILFDVTGSMSPYIKAMIQNIENLMDNLSGLSPSVRIGLASFQDFADKGGSKGDWPYKLEASLTSDVAIIKSKLSALKAYGGGDAPESLATAIRAAVDGNAMPKYFSESDMQWQNDPGRIKIVLGITDASNKATNLPEGAATLQEAAEVMKTQGILFLGIGRKIARTTSTTTTTTTATGTITRESTTTSTTTSKDSTSTSIYSGKTFPSTTVDYTSYEDLAFLARETGAIVAAPGIDLDGDGKTDNYGEVKTGEPAVLLMNSSGQLEGSAPGVDPSRVLADAITLMVERVRPFQFNLVLNSGGRQYAPATNVLSVPPTTKTQVCFSVVQLDALNKNQAFCSQSSEILISSTEELNGSNVDASALRVKLNVDLTCAESADDAFEPPIDSNPPVVVEPAPGTPETPIADENLPWLPPGVVDADRDGIDDVTGEPYM